MRDPGWLDFDSHPVLAAIAAVVFVVGGVLVIRLLCMLVVLVKGAL